MNGAVLNGKYIDTLDCEDPEYQRQMMRPVDVKEDVRQMEQRKRVQLILNSRAFRDELEDIVVEQQILGSPSSNDPTISIQRLSEIIVPRFARMATVEDGIGPSLPINDYNHAEATLLSSDELSFRCKIATLHRVFDMNAWTHPRKCSISGRIGQGVERFLIAPMGLPSNEVTASSLVRIDMRGDIIETQKSVQPTQTSKPVVDKDIFLLHSALYASRPDIRCVAFLSNMQAICISSLKKGLLCISDEAATLGEIGYFWYNGYSLNLEQRDKLRRVMGHSTKIVCVSNFGALIAGESVEETYDLARNFVKAADIQLKTAKSGGSFEIMSDDERLSRFSTHQMSQEDRDGNIWKKGELKYQALMKQLDNFGYKTGYAYKGVKIHPQQNNVSHILTNVASANSKTITEVQPIIPHRELGETIKSSKWNPGNSSTPIKPSHLSSQNQEILPHQTAIDQSFTSKPQVASPNSPQKSVSSTDGEVVSPNKKKEKSTDCDSALIPMLCVHG